MDQDCRRGPGSEIDGSPLRAIADFLPSPVFYCDRSLTYRYVNPAGAQWHGKDPEDIIGRNIAQIMAAGQVELLKTRHSAVLAGETLRFEETRVFGEGGTRRVQTEYVPHKAGNGDVVGFFVMLTDVTERFQAETAARDAAEQIRMISDAVPAQISFIDRDRRYVMVNSTTAEWFARKPEDIVGKTVEDLFGTEFSERTGGFLGRVLDGEKVDYQSEYTFPDGICRALDTTYIPNFRADGSIDGYIVLAYDVSEFKRVEDDLRLLATTDSMTGVYNRRRFLEICNEEIARARRYDRPVSVVMCDVDHFKSVNDTYGHDVGDKVICRFAEVAGREIRTGMDVIGRLGGEEFALLLPETELENARIVAERFRRSWENTEIDAGSASIRTTCSFGVAELSVSHVTDGDLLKQADLALYEAKETGRNRVCGGIHVSGWADNAAAVC